MLEEDKDIYALIDPRTNEVRYVGASANPKKRARTIFIRPKAPKLAAWIDELKRAGWRPIQKILESRVSFAQWEEREQHWIAQFAPSGMLVNESIGGAGAKGVKRGTQTRKKLREALYGRPKCWSPEGKKNRERTQFKKGHKLHLVRTEAQEENRLRGVHESWAKISKEERTRRAKERNRKLWESMTPEQRRELGKKVAQARAKNHTAEELSEIASRNARKALEAPDARIRLSNQVRNWWASLSPEARRDYIARRAKRIADARRAKKLAKQHE